MTALDRFILLMWGGGTILMIVTDPPHALSIAGMSMVFFSLVLAVMRLK
jgi:hypothetical protein